MKLLIYFSFKRDSPCLEMSLSLAGKVCLITGASSGIGAATAVTFVKLGAKVALSGRSVQGLSATVQKCQAVNQADKDSIHTIVADLAVAGDRERLVKETVQKFGKLDVLVNNAGIFAPGSIEAPNLMETYDNVMEVNTRAPLHLLHLATPHLISAKGSVVNVSSVNGQRSFPGILAYNISKAAMDQMTACVALELAPKGVRVNSVNPGVIITELQRRGGVDEAGLQRLYERCKETHPLGRPGNADEVADAIAFLASDASRFTTGACLPVDGGRHATCLR